MASLTWKQFKREIRIHAPGIMIGIATGAVAAGYAIQAGIADISSLVQAGQGALDTLLGRTAAPTELAKYKLYGTFMFFGAAIGLIADKIITRR